MHIKPYPSVSPSYENICEENNVQKDRHSQHEENYLEQVGNG